MTGYADGSLTYNISLISSRKNCSGINYAHCRVVGFTGCIALFMRVVTNHTGLGLSIIGGNNGLHLISRSVAIFPLDLLGQITLFYPYQETLANETPEDVMDAIIALDDLYQAGKLPKEAYEQRRTELKARLATLKGQK